MKTGQLSLAAAALTLISGAALARDTISVAYFLEWPTPNQVAQVQKVYDERLGVTVEWRSFANGNEMAQAMASGDIDISYSQGLVPFVVGVTNGLPLRMVGVAVSYAEADNCVVRDDAGITQANAKDLEGKSVGTPIGNVTYYKLLRTLEHLGVDIEKVNFVQMSGADAAVALLNGDIVMGCAFGGPLTRMMEVGKPLMTAAEQEAIGIRVFDVISATDSFATQHPDLLRKFLEITHEYNAKWDAQADEMLPIIAQAAGMDLPDAKTIIDMFSFPTVEEQKSEAWLTGVVPVYMKEIAAFFATLGRIDKPLEDYSFSIDLSFL